MSSDSYILSVEMEDFVLNSQEGGDSEFSLNDIRDNYIDLYKKFSQKGFDNIVNKDISVLSGSFDIPVRFYRNDSNLSESSPAMLFFHGGGVGFW